MLRSTVVLQVAALALLLASPARAQEGTYDLWLCFEACDESNRASLAYTVAELVLSASPLDLDSVSSAQLLALELAGPAAETAETSANGCLIIHVEAGRDFRPESDAFSLLEWTLTGESEVTIRAPQPPFPTSVTLSLGQAVAGSGTSGDRAVFVSGTTRAPADAIQCAEIVGALPTR